MKGREIASAGTVAEHILSIEELQACVVPEAEQEHILSTEELQACVGPEAWRASRIVKFDLGHGGQIDV